MMTLLQDMRHGWRLLRKSPGLSAVALLTLALGIGANTAIFSVLNAVLLRPLPYRDPSRLVWLSNYLPRVKGDVVATPDFAAWREQSRSLSGLAAYDEGDFNLTGNGVPERIHYAGVSASLFSVLGVQTELGRAVREEENTPGNNAVAVLSNSLWKRRFGGDALVIGRRITLDASVFEVIGVLPEKFIFPTQGSFPDVLVPLSLPAHPDMAGTEGIETLQIIGRLQSSFTVPQAKAELSAIDARLIATYPSAFRNRTEGAEAQVVPLQEKLAGDTRPILFVLFGAVAFLLLIACVNTASLQLTKATARSKELAVRSALGAGNYRLVRQLLTESVLVSMLGGIVGVLLAVWSVSAINLLHPRGLPQFANVALDYRVLTFTFLVAVLTGILSGLAPALFVCKAGVNDTLKDADQSHTETRGVRLARRIFVVSEISLAAVLLVGSGLLVRSFIGLVRVDPGFDPSRLLTLQIGLPDSKYSDNAKQTVFFETLIQRLDSLPGVQRVGAVSGLPLTFDPLSAYLIFEGRPTPLPGLRPQVEMASATSEYFRTMGVPLISGRYFNADDAPKKPAVAVVNQAFVRRFYYGEDPLGKRIQRGTHHGWLTMTIVGVVGDVRNLGPQAEPPAEIFTAFQQDPHSQMAVTLRTTGNPADFTAAVRNEVLALDKEQPIFDIATMQDRLADSLAAERWDMWLLAAFACTALTLAAAGVFAAISYFVVQRTHEIGVRMALGATQSVVLALVLKQGVFLIGLGGIIGLTASIGLTRFLSGMIFGVRANDPITYLAVALLLGGVALLACYIPARRATRVDPMVALRYE